MPVRMTETGPAEVYVIHLLWRLPGRVNLAETIPLRFMPHSLAAIHTRFVQSLHKMKREESGWKSTAAKLKAGNGEAHGALTARLCSCLTNRPDKSPQPEPRWSGTQRAFLKPRSTTPSSVSFHSRPAPFSFDFRTARSVLRQTCFQLQFAVSVSSVKTMSFNQMKGQEAQSRMAAVRKARRNPAAAAALQHRASLVGDGEKWRITNLNQVARAIARWA